MKPEIHAWHIEADSPVTDYTESIFSIGNGYLGLRGFDLQTPKSRKEQHAMFRAGFFEPVKPGITDMVQLPDVLGLTVEGCQPVTFHHVLDLKQGIYTQSWQNQRLSISVERMACMADPQLLCVRMNLTAIDSQRVIIQARLDDHVANLPVNDDQMVDETDTVVLLQTVEKTDCSLRMKALHTGRPICFTQQIWENGEPIPGNCVDLHLGSGQTITVEKRVRVLLDDERPNPEADNPWQTHADAWAALWLDCDIALDAEEEIQGALRWNIFQLLCNNAADDPRISIGARGLTHGRYKGNTFWDTDIFLLPFFCWHRPEAARNLMQYRIRHLPQAKALAQKQNLAGARFPWMCSFDGDEQCESWDIGLCEVHITADVAYALERMLDITGNEMTEDMRLLFLETARYWKSRFTWEEGKGQFSSFFVKGPDEYCGAAINNTYTNYLAKANVELALRYAGDQMDTREKQELRFFADHIVLLHDPARHLYLQDELFDRLEPLPRNHDAGEPLYRTICFDRMQRYKALKQADLIQLMVLFPDQFTEAEKLAIWNVYEPLTVHDSSLSFGVHALLAFQLGLKDKAWDYFTRALFFDLRDELKNTGREGVHMAALGAAWQALVYGALGLWADEEGLRTAPQLPSAIRSISLPLWFRGERYHLTADCQGVSLEKEE
ncbi:MAG: glycoside hydrolase family 65 protein [Clostridia bacterium]|nr:glycoside hydrolase family 65 protein [Clostridia bacterium]